MQSNKILIPLGLIYKSTINMADKVAAEQIFLQVS
jgi:hypothetical protein